MTRSWRFLSFVLVFSLMPGAAEAVENAVHLVGEGHMAHAAQHDDSHSDEGDEHGCNSVFHVCACHAQVSFVVHGGTALTDHTPELEPQLPPSDSDAMATDGVPQSFFRPPIH